MAAITVTPDTFSFVEFTADQIVAAVEHVRSQIGMEASDLHIEVNEESPLTRVELTSLDPISIAAEGGAFENPKKPRHLSAVHTELAVGMRMLQAADRLDAGFGAPPLDEEIGTRLQTVWDISAVGRLSRRGHPAHEPRWRYHWRNRHGFTDVADRWFDRVWGDDDPSWAGLVEASEAALSEES